VEDRIGIETGDMRALPFPDASFDVVVSSLAIHKHIGRTDRAQAVAEAWRVLRPGGRLAIADIRASCPLRPDARQLGATEIARRGLGWRFCCGNPLAGTSLVTASKVSCLAPGRDEEVDIGRCVGADHRASRRSDRLVTPHLASVFAAAI
jgi:SAM-dependent methyltransferase